MSETTDLPPYVIAGEWKDEDWIALSKEAARPLTADQLRRLVAGPRRHPYDMVTAHQVMVGGEAWIFPDRRKAEEATA